jgi:hypothetical protein
MFKCLAGPLNVRVSSEPDSLTRQCKQGGTVVVRQRRQRTEALDEGFECPFRRRHGWRYGCEQPPVPGEDIILLIDDDRIGPAEVVDALRYAIDLLRAVGIGVLKMRFERDPLTISNLDAVDLRLGLAWHFILPRRR